MHKIKKIDIYERLRRHVENLFLKLLFSVQCYRLVYKNSLKDHQTRERKENTKEKEITEHCLKQSRLISVLKL